MKLFGSLAELVQVKWRKDNQEITSRPNQSTTYTSDRDIQLPPGDANHVLVSQNATQALSNKTIDADQNTISNIENADIKAGAAIDASKLADGSVSSTEFQYLSNVSSDIQTQINGKEPTITVLPVAKGGTNSGTALSNNRVIRSTAGAIVEAAAITANRALASDANGIPVHSAATDTELGYLSGVTSALQTQINAKVAASSGSSTSQTLVTPLVDDYADFNEEAAPGTPGSGKVRMYAKSDGRFYGKDDAGTEFSMFGGGASESVSTQTNTDYTITDSDGFTTILVSTGGTNRVINLPTVADNSNRPIRIKKIDSGTGLVTVTAEGAELIDGASTYVLSRQYQEVEVQANNPGTTWNILSRYKSPAEYIARGEGASGHGSTSTTVRRFNSTAVVNTLGVDVTVSDSGTGGTTFLINRPGLYAFSYTDSYSAGSQNFGITLNSTGSNQATQVQDITTVGVIMSILPQNNNGQKVTVTTAPRMLVAGDLIQAQDQGNANLNNLLEFRITQILAL